MNPSVNIQDIEMYTEKFGLGEKEHALGLYSAKNRVQK